MWSLRDFIEKNLYKNLIFNLLHCTVSFYDVTHFIWNYSSEKTNFFEAILNHVYFSKHKIIERELELRFSHQNSNKPIVITFTLNT